MKLQKIVVVIVAAGLVPISVECTTGWCSQLYSEATSVSLPEATSIVNKYAETQIRKYERGDGYEDKVLDQNAFVWRHGNWQDDDKPYQQVRQQIDEAASSGKSSLLLAEQYQSEAAMKQKNALAQFKWSYAVWKSITPETPRYQKDTYCSAGFYSLVFADAPDTYNYSRLRFLLSPNASEQTSLGERLLQRYSQDREVKAHLALDYTATGNEPYTPAAKSRTIALSQELITSNPKYARYYAILAEAYTTSYFANGHHKQDGLAMIAALKKYLGLAKPTEYFYQSAKERVADMEERVGIDQ